MIRTWHELIFIYVINLIWEHLLKTHTMATSCEMVKLIMYTQTCDDRIALLQHRQTFITRVGYPKFLPGNHHLITSFGVSMILRAADLELLTPQVESFGGCDGGSNTEPTQIYCGEMKLPTVMIDTTACPDHTSPYNGALWLHTQRHIYWSASNHQHLFPEHLRTMPIQLLRKAKEKTHCVPFKTHWVQSRTHQECQHLRNWKPYTVCEAVRIEI